MHNAVQCLHSISRTCLAQEFGLVMVLIIEKFQNERTSVAKSLFPSQGEGDNCPKVYNANQQDIDKDGEKQFGSSAPCLLCFFFYLMVKRAQKGRRSPPIDNSNYLNSETFLIFFRMKVSRNGISNVQARVIFATMTLTGTASPTRRTTAPL